MSNGDKTVAREEGGMFTNPWPALVFGLWAAAIALIGLQVFGWSLLPVAAMGLLAAGVAVAIRPASPLILGLAMVTALVANFGIPPSWYSARLLVAVLAAVAGAATVLMLLPRVARRIVFSLAIIVHFGGILTAGLNTSPAPWIASLLWVHVYRPYLQFVYLNNAYHFYSPEPGPATLVWFYVKYDDGTTDWLRIPSKDAHPLAQEYQRRLSFTESVNQLLVTGSIPQAMAEARLENGRRDGIPTHPELADNQQIRVPQLFSKNMLETYARRVAHYPPNPDKNVASVKIYRVIHAILSAKDVADRVDPQLKCLYYPYYQGEYGPDGKLMDPRDPYLYWIIPRLAQRKDPDDKNPEVIDYVEKHARLQTFKTEGRKSFDFIPGREGKVFIKKDIDTPPKK
jgi:hypothetical protein